MFLALAAAEERDGKSRFEHWPGKVKDDFALLGADMAFSCRKRRTTAMGHRVMWKLNFRDVFVLPETMLTARALQEPMLRFLAE